MAASMCDVFSFCVGVAGRARAAVEVRFVSSSKVRPRRTPPGVPTQSGLRNRPTGPYGVWSLAAPLSCGRCGLALARGRGAPWSLAVSAVCHAVDLQNLSARPLPAEQGSTLRRLQQEGLEEPPGPPGPGSGTLLLGSGSAGRGGAEQRELRYKKPWVLRELSK